MNASLTLLRPRPGAPLRPEQPHTLEARVQRLLARTALAWGLPQGLPEVRSRAPLPRGPADDLLHEPVRIVQRQVVSRPRMLAQGHAPGARQR